MSFVMGMLLLLVALVGAFVVGVVALRLVQERPEKSWEYMIAVLIGAGLLVWPVARQTSLNGEQQRIDRYGELLDLEDLGQYRLVNEETGEALTIFVDEDGNVRLSQTETDRAGQGGNATEPSPETRPSPEEAGETGGNEAETVENP